MEVSVLRLGHRFSRDHRVSTHLALVARAFGAKRIIFDVEDDRIMDSVGEVSKSWGGDFLVDFDDNWRGYLKSFEGQKIHLTMYGLPLDDVVSEIKESKENKLVIVGGKKVPSQIFELVDYNVAVGSQPHSEVAALAVFLDHLSGGAGLKKKFIGGKQIIPQPKGKKVVETKR
ncbi:tRNA (cytidine(56)-2'-O)-methyltransferase [Candidatus Altiarchaeota archaeon]